MLYQSKAHRCDDDLPGHGNPWLHTAIGRIVISILLAQGLAYGLQSLCNAALHATATDPMDPVWSTLFGLVLLQVIQAFSLFAAGSLAGAGQRHAGILGGIVGFVHGVVFLVVLRMRGEQLTEVALFGQPLLHIAFGALGGVFGGLVWRPLPVVAMPEFDTDKQPKPRRESSFFSALKGPVAWGRVSAGIVVVTAGFLWGPGLLSVVLDASQGKLKFNDRLQAQLVTWEIIGLATLLGAALAGATTRNGLKQGLCVGVGASILLIGNYLSGRNILVEQIIYTPSSIVGLTIAGGWFGGQLFPPVLTIRRRSSGAEA
ncbi:MAG TPA: hypothetical protein VE988_00655 [Gemmataceae bacterium]|nr:hypothetical protein [Gemmataceae bacterium]